MKQNDVQPKYPIYVVSKNRSDVRLTITELQKMGVHFYVVVEEFDKPNYAKHIPEEQILVIPQKYFDEYETCDDLGDSKSKGPGCARNFAWQHSIDNGFERHWVMDDNIQGFYRFNKNRQFRVYTGAFWRAMEDFVDRYENIAMAGPNYLMFVPRKAVLPPFTMNTRIYSCNLILNKVPYRWRGRYNEDTILSLDMLKDGWCTVQFNAFLQHKVRTQTLKGGNTEEFYAKEGTIPKSQMLVRVHPDVSKIKWRFQRWHHYVDYTPFKRNKLIKKDGITIAKEPNEYNMRLRKVKEAQ